MSTFNNDNFNVDEFIAMSENKQVYEVPLSELVYDTEFNCRGDVDPQSVWELAESIRKNGLQQPVIIRNLNEREQIKYNGKKLKLIAGFRRYKACKILDMPTIRADFRKNISEVEETIINLAENLSRSDLNILQEAQSLVKLRNLGMSRKEIGERFGHGEGWVQVRIMLLDMSPKIKELAAAGLLTYMDIRNLNSYTDESEREVAALDVADRRKNKEKNIMVRKVSKTKRPNTALKKQRTAPEINNLLLYLHNRQVPVGLHTRVLAWAIGTISDTELLYDLKEFVETRPTWNGERWNVPENGQIPDLRNLDENSTAALLREKFITNMVPDDDSDLEELVDASKV